MENKVSLIGYYGSDEVIACSAWTSTSRDLTDEKKDRIPKLINQLWMDGHETPFEKGMVHFLIDTDIASHIHLLKHRISSMNGESARYKELKEDKIYLPEDWKGIPLFNNIFVMFILIFKSSFNSHISMSKMKTSYKSNLTHFSILSIIDAFLIIR